ncbi:MAG: SBBP repeat-containing protein, partial [Promethearchaeota archaeon]
MTQKILSIMIVIFISFPITIYIVVYKQKPGHLYDLSILLENSSKNDQSTQESRQIQNKKIFIEEFLNEDLVYSIALDSSANILVTGSCYRKETDLDVYVSKFSSNGDFSWTTYLDGRFNDIGTDIAVDNKDNIIIAGVTWSTDFNTTPGAIRRPPQISSESNLFVTKFEPSGTMMWSTCLGGSGYDSGITSLAIDSQNNLIIVGSVDSGSYDFNISSDCYDPQPNGDDDVFVTKINENGSLIWSTYLGGSSVDYPTHPLVVFPEQLNEIDVVIDSNDNIIISSSTESDDFPTTENAFNRTYGGGGDIFLSKFNSTGFPLWSTFVGGSRMENGHSVTVDNNDHILITGGTYSPNFPTKNAFSETKNDGYDIFLSKFSSTGSLLWSTYLGGKNDDIGYSVAIDSLNSVYITGRTKSDDYLTTESAYDITFGKGSIFGDAFLTKLTTSGEVVWSTYIGGENDDAGAEVIIDNENNLLIVGNTASPDLESYNTPFRFSFGGEKDGFMSKFQSTGEIISLTRALVVTEPNSDPDNDGLNNMKEFRESTDPLDPDTDNDDIEDGIELENGLDP